MLGTFKGRPPSVDHIFSEIAVHSFLLEDRLVGIEELFVERVDIGFQ